MCGFPLTVSAKCDIAQRIRQRSISQPSTYVEESIMIKVCTAVTRRSDFTQSRFQDHWGTVHPGFAHEIDRISRYLHPHPPLGRVERAS